MIDDEAVTEERPNPHPGDPRWWLPPWPDAVTMRRFIDAQLCPWCSGGPFRVLAIHTSHVHGWGRRDLRNFAGVFMDESICSPDHSTACRDKALQQIADGEMDMKRMLAGKRGNYVFTQAGLESVRKRLRAASAKQQEAAEERRRRLKEQNLACPACGKPVKCRNSHIKAGVTCGAESCRREMIRRSKQGKPRPDIRIRALAKPRCGAQGRKGVCVRLEGHRGGHDSGAWSRRGILLSSLERTGT